MTANNLGGAHVWTLDMDDFSGSFCWTGSYPLINHLRLSMGEYSQNNLTHFRSFYLVTDEQFDQKKFLFLHPSGIV